MSTYTPYFKFVLPAKGEFKGNWNEPVNENFISIDRVLVKLFGNHSGVTPPTDAPDGSNWFNSISQQTFTKIAGSYIRSIVHTHDDIDLPKIDLARHTVGVLPSHMVDTVGLNAAYLGGLTKDDMLYKVGSGLTKSGPIVSMTQIFQDTDYKSFNNVNVDNFGRVISGSQVPVTVHTHAEYALKEGDLNRQFSVANPSISSHAIPMLYADQRFHPKGGSTTQTLKVYNAGSSDDAVNLGQATALFSPISHTHPYATTTHLHDDKYSGLSHTHSEFALISGVTGSLDGTYAKVNGDNTKRFKASDASDLDDVPTLDQVQKSFATLTHTHTGYSLSTHTHSGTYAASVHLHTGEYAEFTHTHNYSTTTHNHAGVYSPITHVHNDLAGSDHDHDATYDKIGHTHIGYANTTHSHDTEYVNKTLGGKFLGPVEVPDTPANDSCAVNKKYVLGLSSGSMTKATADATYAALNGSSLNTFAVSAAVTSNDALNTNKANTLYSSKTHDHDEYLKVSDATINLKRQTTDFIARNGVANGMIDLSTGEPTFLVAAGNNINIEADDTYPFYATLGAGRDKLGDINRVVFAEGNVNGILTEVKAANKHWYLFISYDATSGAPVFNATDVQPVTSNQLPTAPPAGTILFQPVANATWIYNGTLWAINQPVAFIGEFDTDASSNIINIVSYKPGLQNGLMVSDPQVEEGAISKRYAESNFAKIAGDSTVEFTSAIPTGPWGVVNVAHAEATYKRIIAPAGSIGNASPSAAAPTKAEFDDVVSKLNQALAALKSHGIIS